MLEGGAKARDSTASSLLTSKAIKKYIINVKANK